MGGIKPKTASHAVFAFNQILQVFVESSHECRPDLRIEIEPFTAAVNNVQVEFIQCR